MNTEQPENPSASEATLRDYFAAKAMAAYITLNYEDCAINEVRVATWAYQNADAMLTARQKGAAK